MKADFNYESDINPSTQYNTGVQTLNGTYSSTTAAPTGSTSSLAASTWGNGQVKAGLGGSFGYIALGAVNNAGLDINQMTQPFGTAFGSGYGINWSAVGKGYGAGAKVRYDNSVRYISPDLGVTGLRASVTYRNKNSAPANNMFSTTSGLQALSGVREVSAIYMNGPVQLLAVSQQDDGNGIPNIVGTVAASGSKWQTNSLGGNYTWGNSVFYGGYQKASNDTTTSYTTKRVAYAYTMGNFVYKAAYTTLTDNSSTGNYMGNSTTVAGLGVDYNLSKMTALYFRNERTNDNANLLASTQSTNTVSGNVTAGYAGGTTATDQVRSRTLIGLRTLF